MALYCLWVELSRSHTASAPRQPLLLHRQMPDFPSAPGLLSTPHLSATRSRLFWLNLCLTSSIRKPARSLRRPGRTFC